MSYIEREAVLDRLAKVNMDTYYGFTAAVQFGVDHAIQCIKEEPAADVAPVVRCKDCRKRHTDDCSMYYACSRCGRQLDWTNDDGFCDRGERIEISTCHDGVCEIPGIEETDHA